MRTNLLFKLACMAIAAVVLTVHLMRKRLRA